MDMELIFWTFGLPYSMGGSIVMHPIILNCKGDIVCEFSMNIECSIIWGLIQNNQYVVTSIESNDG